jgi:hypothetical protein
MQKRFDILNMIENGELPVEFFFTSGIAVFYI